jgi:uncharacterized membrane protein YeaQ/YmgE (transglycosylase-associated protein family)
MGDTNDKDSFYYTYSAKENQEVLEIRKRYLPHEESKLDELKRLDNLVQNAGAVESLSIGIVGSLIFGLGMCLSLGVIGNMIWLGIIIGVLGAFIMLTAYPVHKKLFAKAKEKHAPRILELADELSKNN